MAAFATRDASEKPAEPGSKEATMALHHDHEQDPKPPGWPDDDPCCPDEPGVRIRAITFEELGGYLEQLANPPGASVPARPRPDRSGRRNQWDAGLLDSHGRPGASAMAQYRRRRAADWRTWRATLPQRLAGMLAAGVGAALATTVVVGPGLARVTGPTAAVALAWLLRFRPSAATVAWRHGAEGERRTARLLAPLERHGYQVFHDLAIPGSAANVDHVVVGPSGVYVIDSKRYRGRLRYSAGHLWHGGRTLDRTLATLWWEATQVAEALGFGPDLHLYPVLCVHVARLPWRRELLVDGVPILAAAALRPALQVPRQALTPEQVALVAGHVRAGFRPAA
jgi:Nuclease-related domain